MIHINLRKFINLTLADHEKIKFLSLVLSLNILFKLIHLYVNTAYFKSVAQIRVTRILVHFKGPSRKVLHNKKNDGNGTKSGVNSIY